MTEHETLAELIGKAKAGDAEAVRELCDRYAAVVRSEVGSSLRGTSAGRTVSESEVVQSGMVQILGHLDELAEGVGNLPAFLGAMAQNKLRSRLRMTQTAGRDTRREEYGEGVLGGLRGDIHTPSEEVARREEEAAFESLLAELSEDERTLVELRMAEYSFAEIGEKLGLTAAAADKRFRRLVTRLRERYIERGGA